MAEADFVELQLHGTVKILLVPAEVLRAQEVHYAKLPEAEKYKSNSTIFLEFVPTWWRYSDFNVDPEEVKEGILG